MVGCEVELSELGSWGQCGSRGLHVTASGGSRGRELHVTAVGGGSGRGLHVTASGGSSSIHVVLWLCWLACLLGLACLLALLDRLLARLQRN